MVFIVLRMKLTLAFIFASATHLVNMSVGLSSSATYAMDRRESRMPSCIAMYLVRKWRAKPAEPASLLAKSALALLSQPMNTGCSMGMPSERSATDAYVVCRLQP